jgi:hypothetical protein
MAKDRLLDRQTRLLAHLTSGAAIFGDGVPAPLDPCLRGIDRGLLGLEARFSFEKRMEKIVAIFPKTFALLGSGEGSIVREFAETCLPVNNTRLANARQFYDFLCARWRRHASEPEYLPDVAACELACATVRAAREAEGEGEGKSKSKSKTNDGLARSIRRHPEAVLLHCAYDVRSIFEPQSVEAAPVKRETPLGVATRPGAYEPQIFELHPLIFDLLGAIGEWTDPVAAFGATPDVETLIRDLAGHGLLQVHA